MTCELQESQAIIFSNQEKGEKVSVCEIKIEKTNCRKTISDNNADKNLCKNEKSDQNILTFSEKKFEYDAFF